MTPRLIPAFAALLLLGGPALRTAAPPSSAADFRGRIEVSVKDSVPGWPDVVAAPKNAPNIVLILLDDVGFGAAGTFGGPVDTPELDKLAATGLRYNRFHVTALCSPTRAALLTGRNHHRVGFGTIADCAEGFPGYDGIWRKKDVPLAEVLRRSGYSTAAFGKWHNTPLWEIGPAGPFDRWPTGLGFEYFYGFMAAMTSQYEPPLYRDTTPVEPRKTPKEGYHFTTDIVNEAIRWVHTHDDATFKKPYFLYLAPAATHAPLQVPAEWIAKYRGKFDQGWDRLREETFARQKRLGVIPANADLTPRPAQLPAWESLSPEEKRLSARQEEVYAAFLAHTDHEVGRLLEAIRNGPDAANTLIIYIVGDNGASGEGGVEGIGMIGSSHPEMPWKEYIRHLDELGGPLMDNHYPSAWAWAGNAPFQWCKQVASHLGGIRNPMIVSWPARIKDRGGLRDQFTHVNDVAPTIYDVTGIPFPAEIDGVKQDPLDGVSFADSFGNAKAASRHTIQYFEMLGNRGIYQDGWFACAWHSLPWDMAGRTDDYGADRWELYHLDEDYSQAHDVAAGHPQKLAEMEALFDREARANDVYPLTAKLKPGPGAPQPLRGKTEFVYYPGTERIPITAAPNFLGSHRIVASLEIPEKGAEGVVISGGGRFGGFTLYVKDGRPVYECNFFGLNRYVIESRVPLPRGKVELAYAYTREEKGLWGGGTGRLYIDGKQVGEGKIAHVGALSYYGTLGIGRQFSSPVSPAYEVPFPFTGKLVTVTVRLPLPQ